MILVLRTSLMAVLAAGVAAGGCSSPPCCRPAPTFPGFLHGVSATSATNAWAVGVDAVPGGRNYTLILHWNGAAWSRVAGASPGFYSGLLGVSAISASSAWAVGEYSTPSGQPRTLIMHWNGTSWSLS